MGIVFATPAFRVQKARQDGEAKALLEARAASSLRLLTYNLFLRPPLINNRGEDYKNERLADFVQEINNFDVVCLQEVFALGSFRRQRLLREAALKGFIYQVTSQCPFFSTFLVDGGLVILSRFPVVGHGQVVFPKGMQSDALSAKGAVFARVQVGERLLNVFTTHLQATYNTDSMDPVHEEQRQRSIAVRDAQLATLRRFMVDMVGISGPGDGVIVAGDLNVDGRRGPEDGSDGFEYERMLDGLNMEREAGGTWPAAPLDVLREATGEHPITSGDAERLPSGQWVGKETVLTMKGEETTRKCLDYIFHYLPSVDSDWFTMQNAAVEPFFIEDRPYTQLSDHYGVACVFSVKEER